MTAKTYNSSIGARPTIRPLLLGRAVVIFCAVIVRYGRTKHERTQLRGKGFRAVYSVNIEEEAERLLALTCAKNGNGDFIAQELAEEQSLPRLYSFGERLRKAHERMT